MAKFLIEWGLGPGGYEDEEVIECENEEVALSVAFDACVATAESYGGLHGYPYYGECQFCEGEGTVDGEVCDECDGEGDFTWEQFVEEVESWASYKVTLVKE